MRTELKAAIAGTVGVTLLLGGAGTLAYWTDSETLAGDDLQAGRLDLAYNNDCDDWTLDGTPGTSLGTGEIVPGDTLTKTCTYAITAEGTHLTGTVLVDKALTETVAALNGLTDELTVSSSFSLQHADSTVEPVTPGTPIDFAQGVHELTATLTASFPFGVSEDNDSQNLLAAFDSVVISLEQTNSHAATP